MKPSEMTNEELADYIVNVIGGGIFKEYYAEAAKRLRNVTVRSDNSAVIAELERRLEAVVKVAKEQFDYIFHSPMCWDEDENESHSLEQLREMEALEKVVATARGEGGES